MYKIEKKVKEDRRINVKEEELYDEVNGKRKGG
jgi:hypothetical protein